MNTCHCVNMFFCPAMAAAGSVMMALSNHCSHQLTLQPGHQLVCNHLQSFQCSGHMTPGQPVRHNDCPGFSRPESMRNQQLAVVFRGPEQHWLVPQMRNGPKALDSLCLVNADKVSVAVLPFLLEGGMYV